MKIGIKRSLIVCALGAATMLTGCVTPYQHVGVTGGYIDKRVDDQTYHVQFSGNGYTSREMVHKYFMYRCAEVTQQQGFKYFMIIPPSLTGSLSTGKNLVAGTGFDRRFMQKTRTSAPVIIYSGGGGGITRWMNSGDIRMFNEDAVFTTKIAGWDASEVLEQLGPYVQSAGKTSAELPMAWVFEPGHPKVRAQDLLPTAPKKPAGSGT